MINQSNSLLAQQNDLNLRPIDNNRRINVVLVENVQLIRRRDHQMSIAQLPLDDAIGKVERIARAIHNVSHDNHPSPRHCRLQILVDDFAFDNVTKDDVAGARAAENLRSVERP